MDIVERFLTEQINPASLSGALVYLALFLLLAWLATRVVGRLVHLSLARDAQRGADPTALVYLQQFARIFIWAAALVLYAHLIPALRDLGTVLLAGVSVASIVLGLAAQNTLGNLIAGISLLVYRPFRVGDRLQVQAPTGVETGTVEALSLGYTILKTFDNRRVVLPNTTMATQVVVNLSSVDPRAMVTIPVSIGYGADIDRAREVLLRLAARHGEASAPFSCPVVNLGASSVDLSLRLWCADAAVAAKVKSDLLEQVARELPKAGIEIPLPASQVLLRNAGAQH